MPWAISFVMAWLIFLLLVRLPLLGYTVWGGLGATFFQIANDWLMIRQDLYHIEQPLLPILHSSAFFTFGPALTMGILFTQYLPRARWLQAVNVVVWAGLFLAMETLLHRTGVLVYQHWNPGLSYFLDVLVLGFLTWLVEDLATHARRQDIGGAVL
ncbi:MAG TPA: hypothetical protein VMW83_06350 [Spirochaetia bacterium]|nr:hypothetical protein [Spirochaetia bacterium]